MDIIKIQRYSLYKLIILMSSLFFLVISINSISSDVSNTYKNDYASRIEINVKNAFGDEQKLIKQSDIETLKMQFSSGSISYMNELDTVLKTENAAYPIKAVLSGENLGDFLGLDILRGTFFSSEQYQYGNKVAVISDIMAQKLFTSHHVIGNEIYISDIKYKIIGLYKNNTSWFSSLASDGIEKVYIPFNGLSKNSEKTINTVFIKDKDLQKKPFKVNAIEKTLEERLRVDSSLYKINDFYDSPIYTAQPLSLFIFLVGVFCICFLIKYLIKYLKFGITYFKSGIKSNYFFEVLLKWKLRIPLFFIVAALILVFIGGVFWIIKFKGAIPSEYVPADNVFDFGFYADKIKDAIYSANNDAGYVPTQLEVLFKNNLMITCMLMLFLIINLIAVVSAIKLNKMVSESLTKQMLVMVISLFIGFVISFALCLVCGIQYSFPAREMIVLVLFLAIKFIDVKKVAAISKKVLTLV